MIVAYCDVCNDKIVAVDQPACIDVERNTWNRIADGTVNAGGLFVKWNEPDRHHYCDACLLDKLTAILGSGSGSRPRGRRVTDVSPAA